MGAQFLSRIAVTVDSLNPLFPSEKMMNRDKYFCLLKMKRSATEIDEVPSIKAALGCLKIYEAKTSK